MTETWLTDLYFDGEILPSGFNIFRKDRSGRGGGVLLAVSDTLSASLLSSPSHLEVLSVKLDLKQPVLVSVVYVPPSANISTLNCLLSYLGSLSSSSECVIVLGDFNCPDIDWATLSGVSPLSLALCDFVFTHNFSQIIDCPTHIKGNILDLVLTNKEDLLNSVSIFFQQIFVF